MSIPSLWADFYKSMNLIKRNKNNEIFDFRDYPFIAPTTFLPIYQYMKLKGITEYKSNSNNKKYLNGAFQGIKSTTTMPVKPLKRFRYENYFNVSEQIEQYLDDLTDEILNFYENDIDYSGFFTVLYEMFTNIYKHSKFNNAYVFSQKYPNSDVIDITMIDDGITIPGSFEQVNIDFINDSEAIYDALNGKSTDKEDFNIHGKGLNTTARIISLGYGKEMLIASREGICKINKRGARLRENKYYCIPGTFISLRINTKKLYNFNELLKTKKIRKNNEKMMEEEI